MASIFRRFDSFHEARAFAMEERKRQTVQIVHSIHKPEKGFERIEGQSYGPWVVEDTEGAGFIRNWETRIGYYPKKGSGQRMKEHLSYVKHLT